jgi:hypothetical protein
VSIEPELLHQILQELRAIRRELKTHDYSVRVRKRLPDMMGDLLMATGNIPAGSSGTFAAQLLDNGSPIALPSGSTFMWSASDSTVTIAPSADTTSAVVDVPAGDPGTSLTITASTVGPDGNTYSGSLSVALTPTPQQFTVTVTQTA